MAKSCVVASLMTCQNLMITILVRSLGPIRTFKTSHELDKILVQFSCLSPDLHELAIILQYSLKDYGQITLVKFLHGGTSSDLTRFSCFLARLYLDQILSGTLEELGVNLGKILANKNLARQSWLLIQDTCKILGNIFSRADNRYIAG